MQYASAASVARVTDAGARISMAAVGTPYDNATAESFFKTRKREEVSLNPYQTFQDAEANLSRFLADVYTTRRVHASLGDLHPIEFAAVRGAPTES